jgi:hypothetical protein
MVEALMSALTRVLTEDGRKSLDLVVHILSIFYCMANFQPFHAILTANKVGDLTFKAILREQERWQQWQTEVSKLSDKTREEKVRKMRSMAKKHDQLFFVSTHLLLNLSEDLAIEMKIVKRNMIGLMLQMLDIQLDRGRVLPATGDKPSADTMIIPPSSVPMSTELVVLVLVFLKKLSVFRENQDEMLAHGAKMVRSLTRLLGQDHQGILVTSLKLLSNMAHDAEFRRLMVEQPVLLQNSPSCSKTPRTPLQRRCSICSTCSAWTTRPRAC